ncbi:RNA polymerase sigma factor [Patescibacteria group bacterium]|nr:RNA polymerase sigma factor [Patescibacteria group bacterium]MBU1563876.1 RNA polymerase sigma factor [Patescibacteria group bacterium]
MRKRQFVKFYDQQAPKIYRFVYLKVSSPQDSEDLTSEAFLKFWQDLADKKEKKEKIDNHRALLYKIANNLVIDFYRKKSRSEVSIDPENTVLAQIKDKTDLNKEVILNSDVIEVKKALNNINEEYQNIIIWRYLDDFSTKEIAQILGKPEGNIRVLTHRALKALKKQM